MRALVTLHILFSMASSLSPPLLAVVGTEMALWRGLSSPLTAMVVISGDHAANAQFVI
jgi:hypothetical protein